MDDEEKTQDAYESLMSLKMIDLRRQIQHRQKELDEVQLSACLSFFTPAFALVCLLAALTQKVVSELYFYVMKLLIQKHYIVKH